MKRRGIGSSFEPLTKIHSESSKSVVEPINWQSIIGLTKKMLESAECQEWEMLIDLESDRKALLTHYFLQDISSNEIDMIRQGIEYILSNDKIISKLINKQQIEIQEQLSQFKKNRNAIQQYNQITR